MIKRIKITKNPFLLFLPFLFLYTIYILILETDTLWGDEVRHLHYAKNLLQGFYSLPAPNIGLETGPAYPIVIFSFLALHLPLIALRILNAVLLYLSIIFLFKALRKIAPFKIAFICSLFWACYYNSLDFISLIYAEVFTVFLITILILSLMNAFNSENKFKSNKNIFLSGFIIGCIALTKMIFGYVILFMLIGNILLWIMNRKSIGYRKGLFILIIAIITVFPYMVYTYRLTKKIYYWGTTGGNNLYWMSTPYKGEYGSWFPDPILKIDSSKFESNDTPTEKGGFFNLKNRTYYTQNYEKSILLNHQKDYEKILKYTGVERDEIYKKIAIKNIKKYPIKYIQNCISNLGRILFNYPYSYTIQKPGTLIRLPLNGTIIVLLLFCFFPAFKNWQEINFSIRFMLVFALIYLGGSILGSAEIRMFTVIVPIFLIFISFVIQKTVNINFSWQKKAFNS